MRILVVNILGLVALAFPAHAHRLDECLLATRIDVRRDQIALDIAVTPGAAVFSEFMKWADRNGDGAVDDQEGKSYGRSLLADSTLMLDDGALELQLIAVAVPPPTALADGAGILRIQANAIAQASEGEHVLRFVSVHHPKECAYLANALLPLDESVKILKQQRDFHQRRLDIRFAITPPRKAAAMPSKATHRSISGALPGTVSVLALAFLLLIRHPRCLA